MAEVDSPITLHEIRRGFRYDPETGALAKLVGDDEWMIVGERAKRNWYLTVRVGDRTYGAHVIIWFYMTGVWPKYRVDHRNRNKRDNKWDNLRHCTQQENLRNSDVRSTNSSGVTGVHWEEFTQKWRASITVDGKNIKLGRFDCFGQAVTHQSVIKTTFLLYFPKAVATLAA